MYRVKFYDTRNDTTATEHAQDYRTARTIALDLCPVDGSADIDWVDHYGTVAAGYVHGPRFTDTDYFPPRFVAQ
jgi:hypothetical protein